MENVEIEIIKKHKPVLCDIYVSQIGYDWYNQLGLIKVRYIKKISELANFLNTIKDTDMTGYGMQSVIYSHCDIELHYILENGKYIYSYEYDYTNTTNKKELDAIDRILANDIE